MELPEKSCILIVDNQLLVRCGVPYLLNSQYPNAVIVISHSTEEAFDHIRLETFDLAIIGISSNVDEAKKIAEKMEGKSWILPIILISAEDINAHSIAKDRDAIISFLTSNIYSRKFLNAVEIALSVSKLENNRDTKKFSLTNLSQIETPGIEILSPQEQKIFYKLAEGLTLKEIGAALGISPKTVTTHRAHILKKLNLDSNAALVMFAITNELI